MTRVYRAIWQDDREKLGDAVQHAFAEWVWERSDGQISVDARGKYSATVERYGEKSVIEVTCETVKNIDDSIRIVRHGYAITGVNDVRWETEVRSWSDDSGGWCWVDTSVVGERILHARRLDVVSPLLVRQLLETGVRSRVGDIEISTKPQYFSGPGAVDELAELVSHFERSIPVVVFAKSERRFKEHGGRASYQSIVEVAATNLAGVAVVAVADEDVAQDFTDMFGVDFGVFNGAFRVYARDVDPAVNRLAYRHRYVTADRYMGDRNQAAVLAGRIVGPESTLRRPPPGFDAVKAEIDRARTGADDFEKLYAMQEADYTKVRDEVLTLRSENVELLEWQQETERLAGQLDYAKTLLITNGICDDFDIDLEGNTYSKLPQTAEDAVSMATKYLSEYLEIHPRALREPKTMNRTNEGAEWASTAWEGFKALYAYAKFMAENRSASIDFTTWCGGKNNSVGWPSDKSARGESGITKEQQKKSRLFPVSVKVSRNEEIDMFSHLKIKQKGNDTIPRVYFLYSPRTGKVHVGFYGPHKLVPNTRS